MAHNGTSHEELPQSAPAPEPNMSVVETQTPTTVEPTASPTTRGGCRPFLGALPSPLTGDGAIEWVQMDSSHLSRVHIRANTRVPAHGVAKTQVYINGLQNVPGGENIAGMRMMQKTPRSRWGRRWPASREGAEPVTAPGWYIGDVSLPWPGRTPGHKSHQSGIGFDITIPVENGGMTMKYGPKYGWKFDWSRVAKRPKNEAEHGVQSTRHGGALESEVSLWNKGFRLDWPAIMQFLKYSAPHCKFIFWYEPHITMARSLAITMAKNNQDGWNLDMVRDLFGSYGKAASGGSIGGARGRRVVRHSGCPHRNRTWDNAQCHANHFHVRLAGAGKFDKHGKGNALDSGHGAAIAEMKADWRRRVAAGTAGVKQS